jgi:hypothetical protein
MKHVTTALLVFSLSGCMSAAQTPSLQPRAIESRGEAVEAPPQQPAVQPVDATLTAKIAALVAEAARGDAEFARTDTSTNAAIRAGRNARTGSEAWIAGEQARSALEAARQRTASALGEIDALVIAQVEAAASDPAKGGSVELQTAQSTIAAMVARQSARIEELTR